MVRHALEARSKLTLHAFTSVATDRNGYSTRPALRRPASGSRAPRPRARSRGCASLRAGTRPGLDQPDRRIVGARRHAERALDRDLLHDDEIADEVGHGLEALDAGEHDAPAGGDVVQRLGDRFGRVRGDLDDDVGAVAVGELRTRRARVLLLDVDDVIGAELLGERQLLCVARETGDDDRIGAGGARRDHAREAALARDRGSSTVSPGPVSGISTAQRKPAPSGLNITAMFGRDVRAHGCTIENGSRYM